MAKPDNKTKAPVKANTFNRVVSRIGAFFNTQFNGQRDMDETLGYTPQLRWEDYVRQYLRGDIAFRICNAFPQATWDDDIQLVDDPDTEEETEFEKAFKQLARRSNLFYYLTRADILANVGHYSVLFFGVRDGIEDLKEPIGKVKDYKDLLFFQTFGQQNAQIQEYEVNLTEERYGLPKLYTLQSGGYEIPGIQQGAVFGSTSNNVHHSRLIHVAEGALENDVIGTPRLQPIMNRLKDLEKVVGGSAESYWRNARAEMHVNIEGIDSENELESGFEEGALEDIKEEAEDVSHGFDRVLLTQGANVSLLSQPITAPDKHAAVLIELIAGTIGIPMRILVGSERGELASTQDETQWLGRVKERRERYAEPMILRPLVDRFIEIGVLPAPLGGEYQVIFPDLLNIGEKDKAEIASKKSTALASYANSMAAQSIMPPRQFMKEVMSSEYREDEIDEMLRQENEEIDQQRQTENDDDAVQSE